MLGIKDEDVGVALKEAKIFWAKSDFLSDKNFILEFLNTNRISANQDLIIKFLVDRRYKYKIIDENCCFGDFFDLKKCRNFLFYY